MALRTFRHNPSLGGFGGESSSSPLGDDDNAAVGAFCQIVKEIADNAVDACRGGQTVHNNNNNNNNDKSNLRSIKSKKNTNNNTTTSFRIRVNLDPVTEDDGTQVMRLTVTDNGCGMQDIQNCVDAFQTTKGHNATKIINHNNNNDNQQRDANTSGRYGIGLTRKSFVWQKGYPQAQLVSPFFTSAFVFGSVCLLHAQRLVPNTRASIKSATAMQPNWTVMSCVVDTQADSVRCFPGTSVRKTTPEQSGTSVSLLIPVRKHF